MNACAVPVLEGRHLTKRFRPGGGRRAGSSHAGAVDDCSIAICAGESVALVGESGAGKSTLGRLLARLETPTSGELLLRGEPAGAARRAARPYRRSVQMILQDPFASLNPMHTVGYHLRRSLKIHRRMVGPELRAQVVGTLERVQLTPAERLVDTFPGELSGGQRQRVSIARALAAGPAVLIADEPVAMLDVSIRLGILNLLGELVRDDDLGLLCITHDLAAARYLADRIVVMYAGRLIEAGPAAQVIDNPLHPYTRALVAAAPGAAPADRPVPLIPAGEVSRPVGPPSGCPYQSRCPVALPRCSRDRPTPVHLGAGRWTACWLLANGAEPVPA